MQSTFWYVLGVWWDLNEIQIYRERFFCVKLAYLKSMYKLYNILFFNNNYVQWSNHNVPSLAMRSFNQILLK